MKPKRKRRLQNLILLLFSTAITLVVAEYAYRWVLFSGGENFKGMRAPAYFCSDSEDDYWKLYYEFGGDFKPPKSPHPLLGWVGEFDRQTYLHYETVKVGSRRPVLLYGDSFSACVKESQCFQDLLNVDSTFNKNNYLLNYGVGGYGVDQAAMLCSKTAPHFERPLVVFGMLTTDMDRTILSVRTGQKPYLDEEGGKLKLKGLPIDLDPAHYFEENGVGINSYLYRRFLHSDMNFLPYRITSSLNKKYDWIEKKKRVNALLVKKITAELKANDIDFVFLIFHFEDDMMSPNSEKNWRDQHLREIMAENDAPYIWSKDIIRAHREAHPENKHDAYIIPGNGHPTSLYNQLISNRIKEIANEYPIRPKRSQYSPLLLEHLIAAAKDRIRNDEAWLIRTQEKADKNGLSLDSQLHKDAYFIVNETLKEAPFPTEALKTGAL